eukprot:CAMPEP_0185727832 /NCGR_PEP_ID=MMETSP1171-20130828/3405_1 /TAXON_ID=374046 /ORGANISM="Helicotheca tamensis, Strain CCMP826" /LENGTH=485 /DNA_ID=CAMNT_0028396469 /DNA_START=136 /DNA_END=1590 /DNA_ORIENTATION=+
MASSKRTRKSAAHAACILAVVVATATASPSANTPTITASSSIAVSTVSCFAAPSSSNQSSRVRRIRQRSDWGTCIGTTAHLLDPKEISLSFSRGTVCDSGAIADASKSERLRARIQSGMSSPSPSWRRRTRHAATCLQRRSKAEKEGSAKRKGGLQPPAALSARSSFPKRKPSRQMTQQDEEEYERRKREWAATYTSVSTLRSTFGTNRNKLWGDYDPETTRRLYHTLLPRALLGLHELGLMKPDELAPLAYEARTAAKKYARERCVVPGRVLAMAYDGYRQWKNYGKFNVEGMSWDQIWQKYERQVVNEQAQRKEDEDVTERRKQARALEEDITEQVCLKILERSCISNDAVDRLILGHSRDEVVVDKEAADRKRAKDFATITAKIQQDIDELLFQDEQGRSTSGNKTTRKPLSTLTSAEVSSLRILVAAKKKIGKFLKKNSDAKVSVDNNQPAGLEIISASEVISSAKKNVGSRLPRRGKKVW